MAHRQVPASGAGDRSRPSQELPEALGTRRSALPANVHRRLQQRRRTPVPTRSLDRREATTRVGRQSSAGPVALPSSRQLAWLLVRSPESLSCTEAAIVRGFGQDAALTHVVDLVQRFAALVCAMRERILCAQRGGEAPADESVARERFKAWLGEAKKSEAREVRTSAAGLAQYGDAVPLALTLEQCSVGRTNHEAEAAEPLDVWPGKP